MDYKYIEQLLERYWQCETSLEEEQILRSFFSQAEVPAELQKYRSLFVYEQAERNADNDGLSDDFDERMLALIADATPVKAVRIPLTERFKPLIKAAAMVALVVTLGTVMQIPFTHEGFMTGKIFTANEGEDPEVAYDEVKDAFGLAAEIAPKQTTDSTAVEMAQVAPTATTTTDTLTER